MLQFWGQTAVKHWFEKYSLIMSAFFLILEMKILDNGWNIRSPFYINNFFMSTPKKFWGRKVYYPGYNNMQA